MHPQSIYYSLRTFVLGLREAAQRALQEHSKHRAGLEAAVAAALEAAGGDEQSEWAGGAGLCSEAWHCMHS
jgi:tryptophan 2,3-dioxygenase